MNEFEKRLNNILVDTFHQIIKVEEQMIQKSSAVHLSINEMHLIESVGKKKDPGKSISDIAKDLNITLPSVTIAINKLVKKGFVEKTVGKIDGRMVHVCLTKSGQKMDALHRYFHKCMVRDISSHFSANEKNILVEVITKLNTFFSKKIEGANA